MGSRPSEHRWSHVVGEITKHCWPNVQGPNFKARLSWQFFKKCTLYTVSPIPTYLVMCWVVVGVRTFSSCNWLTKPALYSIQQTVMSIYTQVSKHEFGETEHSTSMRYSNSYIIYCVSKQISTWAQANPSTNTISWNELIHILSI